MSAVLRLLDRVKPWQWWTAGGVVFAYLLFRKGKPSLGFTGAAEPFASGFGVETACDPTEKPGTQAFRRFVLAHYGGTDLGIVRPCADAPSGHQAGRAWDWGVAGGDPDRMLRDLLADDAEWFRRAGLIYVIYDRQIYNARSRRWQNYTGPSPHTDHVHFSFSPEGAAGDTSFYRAIA